MAYAVVKSLKQTIDGLVRDDSGHICIVENSCRDMLKSVYEELDSLEKVLDKLNKGSSIRRSTSRSRNINRERVNALDGQIREALCEFEDILDFHVSDQFHSQIQPGDDNIIYPSLLFTLKFEQLTQQSDSFKQKLKMIKEDYILELCLEEEEYPEEDDDDLEEEEEEDEAEQVMNVVPTITDHHHFVDGDESDSDDDLVGLSHTFAKVKDEITEDDELSRSGWKITFFWGIAGIGKTALAKKVFRDPQIASLFQRRAFVTIGQKYQLEAVLLDILTRLDPEKASLIEQNSSAALLKRLVYQSLKSRSCFIVLDDVWHKTIWDELKSIFPKNFNNHCRVLLTSRLGKLASAPVDFYLIPFLTKKESWHLLRKKVFGDHEESSCPRQLVKAGEKIAENCDGLPLTILKVANILLSKGDMTPEFWNEVAAQKQHPVFIDAYERMYEVLYKSYDYLPQYLKPVFLYLGVFPQHYEIPSSEIINLLYVEGLYKEYPPKLLLYLRKLCSKSLVMLLDFTFHNVTKKIRLHSVFWYMCNKEARRNKFFYSLNIGADSLAEDMESQRRLCIQNNVLFGIKDVHNSISSISTVRSLLCTGAYHQYPVPICLGSRLLKVLHALTIRFYEFPMEVLNRVNMTYLALTLDGKIPSSISRLCNLKYLIIRRHVRIVEFGGSSSYLPMEMWKMKELQHLQVMGSDLPNPNCEDDDHILPNIFCLSGVSAQSCTKHIFKRIPCLEKLGVRIELSLDDDQVPLCFFDDISHLHKLDTLKCIMATPKIVSGVVAPPAPLSIFSQSLSKLTLSGMGYPWEEMTKISSSLPNLMVLKLRCYAFRGPEWVVAEKGFPKLNSLIIEDTDLVKWTSLQDYYSLENLKWLTIKHCYKLQDIPNTLFGESLQRIELVDCNPLATSCAEQVKKHLQKHLDKKYPREKRSVRLKITSSWGDEK